MHSTYFLLLFEFFKTGLFTFGGGYASLPFLYAMSETYNWFSNTELTQLIAVSGITPGPIGLNMATFAGFKTLGIQGSIIASISLVLPMLIITSRVFKLYNKFSENKYVKSILYVLRPTSCALISAVGLKLFYSLVLNEHLSFASVDIKALLLVILLFLITFKSDRTPIIYMTVAGAAGIIFYLLKLL